MAYDSKKVIKQITVGSTNYDLNALYIQDGSGNGKTWADITSLVETGFEVEVVTTLPTITESNYGTYRNKLLLIADTGAEAGTYLEYVAYKTSGTTPTYGLEQIGSTKTDLSNYVQKGTYTTGNGGAGNTGEADLGTVTGTASGNYLKPNANTGEVGNHAHSVAITLADGGRAIVTGMDYYTGEAGGTGTSANTGDGGGGNADISKLTVSYTKANANTNETGGHTHSISPTTATLNYVTGASTTVSVLKGVKATASDSFVKAAIKSASLDWKTVSTANYQAVVTGVNDAASAGSHSHKVDSHSHATNQNVVTGYPNFSGGSATGTFVTGVSTNASVGGDRNYGFTASTSNVMTAPTVSATGVLSWTLVNATKQDAHTMTQMTFSTASVGWTAASLGTASTVSVAGAASAATLTSTSAGDHTHTVGASETKWLAITTAAADSKANAVTAVGADGTATVVETLATGSQTIVTGVSQTGTAGSHSHTVGSSTASATVGGTVSMAAHNHSYTKPANHTHSMGFVKEDVAFVTPGTYTCNTGAAGGHSHSIGTTKTAITDGACSVAVGKHSHSIGNHTHNVDLN